MDRSEYMTRGDGVFQMGEGIYFWAENLGWGIKFEN